LDGINWVELVSPVAKANTALARYDGLLEAIPNPGLLLSPLSAQEAVISSGIEGTVTTVENVFRYEAGATGEEGRNEAREVANYRAALLFAEQELSKRPLCLNLIKSMHRILLEGVRGRDKGRGEFRRVQNLITGTGYVPPEPEKVMDYMSNLEEYCHFEEKDRLVQAAIIHAQFEMIHPFVDGNGRIGRILVPIFLYEKGKLHSPMFYVSAHIDATRPEYYDRLLAVSENQDWTGWIEYFLGTIVAQAQTNSQKVKSIMDLYGKMKEVVSDLTHSRFAIQTLDFLFATPVFNSSLLAARANIPRMSATRILNALQQGGIISRAVEGRGRRPSLYTFPLLLEIVEA
jgi:Fic family protein